MKRSFGDSLLEAVKISANQNSLFDILYKANMRISISRSIIKALFFFFFRSATSEQKKFGRFRSQFEGLGYRLISALP